MLKAIKIVFLDILVFTVLPWIPDHLLNFLRSVGNDKKVGKEINKKSPPGDGQMD